MSIRDSVGVHDSAGHRYRDEAGNPILLGQKLGEGGVGVVYLVDGQPGSVARLWRPERTPPDADARIRNMMANPVIPGPGAAWHLAWPTHLVIDHGADADGATVGYTLPYLDLDPYWTSLWIRVVEANRGRHLPMADRVHVALNLALAFRALHSAGYVIGDVNGKDVFASQQNDVILTDCDSYGFTDPATGRTFPDSRLGIPEFQAPETIRSGYHNRTQEQDLFGLAVLIFFLLTGHYPHVVVGQHAIDYPMFSDRIGAWLFPPADSSLTAPQPYYDAWNTLSDRQSELFMRCFDRRHEGQPRPTAQEWAEALGYRETESASAGVHHRTEFADNPEARCPIVLILDVSASMSGDPIATVNQALVKFHDVIRNDSIAALRADVAIVAFSDDARVMVDFTNGADFQPPVLTAGGRANVNAGIELALDVTQHRKQNYRDAGIAHYRSLVYFLTAGAGQVDPGIANRLAQMEADRSIAFFSFAIGGDGSQLSSGLPRQPMALTNLAQLEGSIAWLSKSVSSISQSQVGDSIRLPQPDYLNF